MRRITLFLCLLASACWAQNIVIVQPGNPMLLMKLTRLGSSDAYNSAVKLLEFDIHYKHNKFGAGSF